MKRLRTTYWRHEAWALRAVMDNNILIFVLRSETLAVWYLGPLALLLLANGGLEPEGVVSWVFRGLVALSLIWAAWGVFTLTYFLRFMGEVRFFGSPVGTAHPMTEARLRKLEYRIGAA